MINKLIIDDYNVELSDKTEMPYSYTFAEAQKHIVRYGLDGDDEICAYAFEGCKNLTYIEIPEVVTKIKRSAFKDCSNLKKVPLKKTINYIGKNAFDGCTKLEEITFEGTEVPAVHCTFPSQTIIYVPTDSKYVPVSYSDIDFSRNTQYFEKTFYNGYNPIEDITEITEFVKDEDGNDTTVKNIYYRNKWDELGDNYHIIEEKNRIPISTIDSANGETRIDFTVGQTRTIGITILPDNATNKNIVWTFNKNDYFTINTNTGILGEVEVTALNPLDGEGNPIITQVVSRTLTATSENNRNFTFTLYVHPA